MSFTTNVSPASGGGAPPSTRAAGSKLSAQSSEP
jgi:hypothetical protein